MQNQFTEKQILALNTLLRLTQERLDRTSGYAALLFIQEMETAIETVSAMIKPKPEVKLVEQNAPRYLHDCPDCKFLGNEDGNDLYVCESAGETEFVARYGSLGHQYVSRPFFVRPTGLFVKAQQLAEEANLIEP